EEAGRVLIDATAYFLTDVMDVRGTLRRGNAGIYQLDRERSAYHLARTWAFPENTEIEASLTFSSDAPGGEIDRHAPDGRAVTVRQHHSLVKLPPLGYTPRRFNTRAGVNGVAFYDFSKGYEEPYESAYIRRHRLVKLNPAAAVSDPVEPIVYYMDPGIQEPYRTAFKQGLAWYEQVFRAAGFSHAFRVEDMPPDMDPLDARYHVIQWMHRSNIGASVGPSFVDPRTGEIIKAAVRMDSHRSLTNYDLFSGTLGEADGSGLEELSDWLAALAPQGSVDDVIIARRRQHAAHEVGHTLGLPHNFAASKYGRGSVMDYPAPIIRLVNGRLDLTQAYRAGPGLWDTLAIRYAYTPFPEGREDAGLAAIADEMFARNAEFITNPDNAASGSYPEASAWDNGNDVVAELARVMEVRRYLLEQFDERAIKPGAPMYLLGRRFGFVYLHHRWTLEAAIKAVGGMEYHYARRGDPIPPTRLVDGARQRQALDLVLRAVSPEELAIPERLLRLFAPRPFGSTSDRWAFGSQAGPAFDQVGAARSLATYAVQNLLHPERTARVVAFSARDASLPTLEDVIGTLVDRTWAPAPDGATGTLARAVQRVVVDELIRLAANTQAAVESRAAAEWG
ncbi:MAG TPA: zinc-dependent metalloprotease, partial [Gemmatimonadales bacterium]